MSKIYSFRGLVFACLCFAWNGLTFASDPADVAEGHEIYDLYCGACHGAGGRAQISGTPSFAEGERLDKSVDELIESINDGKGPVMPGWSSILSPAECQQVLDFILSIPGE